MPSCGRWHRRAHLRRAPLPAAQTAAPPAAPSALRGRGSSSGGLCTRVTDMPHTQPPASGPAPQPRGSLRKPVTRKPGKCRTLPVKFLHAGTKGLTPTEPMQSAPGCSVSPPPLSVQVLPAPERPSASAAAARPSSAAASSGSACAASARAGAPGSRTCASQTPVGSLQGDGAGRVHLLTALAWHGLGHAHACVHSGQRHCFAHGWRAGSSIS